MVRKILKQVFPLLDQSSYTQTDSPIAPSAETLKLNNDLSPFGESITTRNIVHHDNENQSVELI